MDKVSIFGKALLKATAEERQRFLDETCGDDVELRAEIDALLAAHDDAGSFLQKTPEEFAATVDAPSDSASTVDDESWRTFLAPSETPECLGTIAQYEVAELIGRGGMGVVLRARDPKLNRVVALKMLAPEMSADPVAVKRFLREAQAAAAVSHDHVVTIHAVDEDTRPPIIAMEFIDGKSLQQKIDSVGTLDVKSILRIGMQTASGLAAAHRQGLVHRDVKPANILLENGVERVKLTDFGLARAIDDIGMTKTGTITGTPQYMSPEQAQGEPVDHRTDLFSLGCVLYAMCTGQAAFRADSAVAVLHCVVHQAPRPIRQINEDIPEWLCEIVAKLLAKNPDDRFASAAEVETLLSQHLAHEQQPDSVPRPERIPLASQTALNGPANSASHLSPENELPVSFFSRIPSWMIGLVVLLAVLAMLQTNVDRLFAALSTIIVAVPVFLLSRYLDRKESEAAEQGLIYSGYAKVVAVGICLSFGIPFVILDGTTAMIFAILGVSMTTSHLQTIRMKSFNKLRALEGDQPHWGWRFADGLNRVRPALFGILFIAILGVSLTSTRGPKSVPTNQYSFGEEWLILLLILIIALPPGLGLWLLLRRRRK